MKDNKTLLLLVVSLLLLLASITLLWSWGYQFSFNHNEATSSEPVKIKTNTRSEANISDSLQKIYYTTLAHLDKTIDSIYTHTDSIKGNLVNNLTDFYKTRNQIADLFKNRAGNGDIAIANQRILQLQQRISLLSSSNADIEKENKRLNILLKQYLDENKKASNTSTQSAASIVTQKNTTVDNDNENEPATVEPTHYNNEATTLAVGNVQIIATSADDGKETLSADNAGKITGAFSVKNNSSQNSRTDLYVVLLQPDGKTLQKSTWESGSFETPAGKRIYSCKLMAQCAPGESKKLQFWIAADKYQKGNYTLLIYQNGEVIARASKILS
ncbi:MAG: hypothetical protein JSU03_11495 [Bacteroidetes bacterium]|nr:hypothetical protein [Bacteroidota bacterium]